MYNIIFYLSYIIFPFLIYLFSVYKKGKPFAKKVIIILFLFSFLFIYSRFIERNMIVIKTTEIEVGFSGKFVIISDLHLGVYKKADFLKRVVKKINKIENVTAVLIPGDFIYHPSNNLDDLFYPLKDIDVPVYAVFGNHDSQKPGPPIQNKLKKVLENNNVILLHNENSIIRNINILGLGDRWANEDNISMINNFSENDNLVVITHNPNTALRYKNSIPDLTISGHTHGGQIRIPFLYKNIFPHLQDFDQGLYKAMHGKVFVTGGIGEVGLPMRFGIPPTIEILELK